MWLGRWLCCWLVLAWVTAVHGAAGPRVGPLEVRTGAAGGPCFTISEAEEQRGGAPQFDAISVADVTSPKVRLPVLPRTMAADLARGRVYEVTILPRAPGSGTPRVYRARFCVGTRGVQQLAAGEACAA